MSKRRYTGQGSEDTSPLPKRPCLPQDNVDTDPTGGKPDAGIISLMSDSHGIAPQQDLPREKLPELLQFIINTAQKINGSSPQIRSLQYDDLEDLINKHPEIETALNLAWKEKTFKEIRMSRFFRLCELPPSSSPLMEKRQTEAITDQFKATEDAWNSAYRGKYARLLANTILDEYLGVEDKVTKERVKNPEINHTNYLVAIQSSGAGKSRTVHEVGAILLSIPINLREKAGTGYPLRDQALCDFFDQVAHLDDVQKKIYCAAFIAGVFSAALGIVKQTSEPQEFREIIGARKSEFDVEAAKNAAAILSLPEISSETKPNSQLYRFILDQHTRPSINEFATTAGIDRERGQLVLLAIDECHTLNTVSTTQSRSTYHLLCSVLHDLIDTTLFAIFMSTTSHTRQLAPPIIEDPSARVHDKEGTNVLTQHPPYVAFPFDVYKDDHIIIENEMTISDVCDPSFICRFGRPLWWTRWDAGNDTVRGEIVDFAMAKLNGSSNFNSDTKSATLAALSTRHLLMFEPDRRSSELNDEAYKEALAEDYRQVASHMRTVHSVPDHRQYMWTSTPSEPLLAEAAAQLLFAKRINPVRFLAKDLNPLVGKGERGELCGRVLMNLAHDFAVKRLPSTPHSSIKYARPIPLLKFLQALMADKWHDVVLNSRPVGGKGETLRDAFAGYYVHFTHWSKLGDTSGLSTAALWKAIARGTAWQCCDGMPGIDYLIPVVSGIDAKLGRGTVSVLAVQIKARSIAAKVYLKTTFHKDLFSDAPNGQEHPFIFLTLQLGVQPTAASAKAKDMPSTPSKMAVAKQPSHTSRVLRSTSAAKSKAQRYDITIYGCSPTVYNVVKEEDRDFWAQLLSARSLKKEHPRQTSDHFELLVRSKPMFWHGPHSYDWAKDKGPITEDEELVEEVVVGEGGRDTDSEGEDHEDEMDTGSF